MRNHRKGIWFPISLGVLVILIAFWVPVTYGNTYLLNYRLLTSGMVENARIIRKGIMVNDALEWRELSQSDQENQLQVMLSGTVNVGKSCQFTVSEEIYDTHPIGSKILVSYLPGKQSNCRALDSIPGVQRILTIGMGFSILMMLIGFTSLFLTIRSHNIAGPGDASALTTNLHINGMPCPKCNANMTEGYLTTGRGIVWRDIDQPVGIPNMFSGLPGTVFFGKRQKLHAYHCDSCMIATFKYGRG